jgi:hypothetical protein
MITERIDKQLMDRCIACYKLSSTIPGDTPKKNCGSCGSPLVPMRLDRLPNMAAREFMSDNDICFFYGCPSCNTVLYDEDELNNYACKKTSLKVILAGIFGIEAVE